MLKARPSSLSSVCFVHPDFDGRNGSLWLVALCNFTAPGVQERKLLLQPVLLCAYGLVLWVGIGLWWNGHMQGFAEMRWVFSLIGLTLALSSALDDSKLKSSIIH